MNLHKKINSFYSKHIITSWILSYLIIFIIPFANSIYSYARTERAMKQRIYRSDSQMLANIISTFDKSISDFSSIAASIQNLESVTELMNASSGGSAFDLNCINTARSLGTLQNYNAMLSELYVYFNASDYCVSTSRSSDRASFFPVIFDQTNVQPNEWQNYLNGFHYASYMVSHNNSGTANVDFFYSLPLRQTLSKATAAIRVSSSAFDNIINKYTDAQERSIFIIDSSGNRIYGKQGQIALSYNNLPNGISYDKKTRSTVISQTSSLNNWKYVSVTPQSIISEQLRYLRMQIIISLILSALVACALALYFTRKNYEPLENIISVAGKKLAASGSGKNEYELINDILNDYVTNRQQLSRIKHNVSAERKNKLLSQLALGGAVNIQEMNSLGIKFVSDYFAVVCFNITNANHLFSTDDNTPQLPDNDETAQLIQFILTNVFEEIIGRIGCGYVAETEGKLICIISFDDNRLKSWYDDVSGAVAEAKQFINDNFQFSFNASISSMHKGIGSISSAYWEANHALSYRSFIKNENLISFENMQSSAAGSSFNDELYHRMINFVKLGNYSVAQSIADNIFSSENMDVNYVYVVILRIAADVSSAVLSGAGSGAQTDSAAFLRCVDELITADSHYSSYREKLSRLLKLACEIMEQRGTSSASLTEAAAPLSCDSLTQNVKDYIQQNYSDCNLHLVSLGEHFDITPYYLSNIFKKEEGMALMDYIAKLRIDKAKEYIDRSDSSMSDIAEMAGFNNARTFLRTFKKFEGITPSQYKDLKSNTAHED